jgi:hypothetical protein
MSCKIQVRVKLADDIIANSVAVGVTCGMWCCSQSHSDHRVYTGMKHRESKKRKTCEHANLTATAIWKMKVVELKEALQTRNLATTGCKADLTSRLLAACDGGASTSDNDTVMVTTIADLQRQVDEFSAVIHRLDGNVQNKIS